MFFGQGQLKTAGKADADHGIKSPPVYRILNYYKNKNITHLARPVLGGAGGAALSIPRYRYSRV